MWYLDVMIVRFAAENVAQVLAVGTVIEIQPEAQ